MLVNGHGYENLIQIFLKPFFQSKIDMNLETISSYNVQALDNLGTKQVKRSTVSYKKGSSYSCKNCQFITKSFSLLKKHRVNDHALSQNLSNLSLPSISGKHSTRNNSITEALLQENITITDISDTNTSEKVTIEDVIDTDDVETRNKNLAPLSNLNILVFKCKNCNNAFQTKKNLNTHNEVVHTINQQIKCTPCKLVFQTELDLEWHIETEHEPSIKVLLSTS